METIETIAEMNTRAAALRAGGTVIGFVPTMGDLHEGHLSLVRIAGELADTVVVSIFVNPTQFGPSEDYECYPRNIERDAELANEAGCDILFVPSAAEIYPPGHATIVRVEGLSEKMCGAVRPGHFEGVATVVAKLFSIVRPNIAILGQKDAQQATIIERMTADLDMGVEIVRGSIVREADGLAMSSRNTYLSDNERAQARVLFEALSLARARVDAGETRASEVLCEMRELIESRPLASVQYIVAVDPGTLEDEPELGSGVMLALAVFVGKTRLIDNLVL